MLTEFINEFCRKKNIQFYLYDEPEDQIRHKASLITKALHKKYPHLNITEVIESETHKPPFSVSWTH